MSLSVFLLVIYYFSIVNSVIIKKTVFVDLRGKGDFTTIKDVVGAAPINTKSEDGYFQISVCADVAGDNFVAINITFRNTHGRDSQAIVVENSAKHSAFYNCTFEGYQDTLLANKGTQFYRECDIYGTIDFIYGNAAAVFQNCNIFVRLPLKGQFNVIVAQGREDQDDTTGFSFQNCSVLATNDLIPYLGYVRTYLARPWKDYSRVIYMQSFLDSLIEPAGWTIWDDHTDTRILYFAEYKNDGPGFQPNKRVNWTSYHKLNKKEASRFTVFKFIFGNRWLPMTGVPFYGGLV